MDTSLWKHEDFLKLANEFLSTKNRENYYDFKAFDDNYGEEYNFSNPLKDEDVAALRALKAKYGEEFVKHLDEVFDNPDTIHDFTGGCEILDIDLDFVWHKYAVTIHEMISDGSLITHSWKIALRDDEYANLLARLLSEKHLPLNLLRHYDDNLYGTIMREVDHYYRDYECLCYMMDNPFLVTLDEAETDADTIAGQHGFERAKGHHVAFD